MTMVKYEAKFTLLSHFAPDLIANEERKAFSFKDSLNPFLKDKLFFKLETYLEMIDDALLVKKSSKEIQHYRKQ